MHRQEAYLVVFKRGQFKINGQYSDDFNAVMTERPERISPGRVIELRPRPGSDSVVIDYQYYKNVVWNIKCYAKASSLDQVAHLEDRIRAWLDMSNYSDFIYQFDEHYVYQAVVVDDVKFTSNRLNGPMVRFEFAISLRPFKMSRTGLKWLTNEPALINIEKYPSEPKIHIKGSGDISFWINEKRFDLKNVGNEIIIDSQLEESYRVVDGVMEIQDHKTTFKDFPVLPIGRSNFRWQGNVQQFNILPRWRTKI